MISSNVKRALLAATAVLGAALAGPAMSQPPESEAVYNYYYYDANWELILYSYDQCNFNGIDRANTPTGTVYVVQEFYAYCRGGQLTQN